MSSFRWTSLHKFKDFGLLILRAGVGLSMAAHGWPKLAGGEAKWEKLGRTMEVIGIDFAPVFWGLMAGLAEFIGGLLVAIGLFTRPAAALVCFTMLIAVLMHVDAGHTYTKTSHSLELFFVYFGLIFVGPGKYSLDKT